MPIEIILEQVAEARRWAAHTAREADRLEVRLLDEYVAEHRQYTNGYRFEYKGVPFKIHAAMGTILFNTILIGYRAVCVDNPMIRTIIAEEKITALINY